ncbi:MAG TPA: isochorismatase family cysteine hydrolase [Dehalococcoidales bacterium]|nr:isochorismatase family cysteine hydrolase [Dehalococcoidales bacterium]
MKAFGKLAILESLEEIVSPEHTALVLWDCQNGLINNIFNWDEYLTNLKFLLDDSRKRKIPVIYTKITPLPPEYQSAWTLYQAMKRFKTDDPLKLPVFMKPGSPEAEINKEIAPWEGDVVLNKNGANIFFGTNFEQMMHARGIKTIIFTGIATEIGIEHSAREAGLRGFYPVVASDCVSSADKMAHEMALKIMNRLCVVISSKDIVAGWAV